MRRASKILVGKYDSLRLLGDPRRGWNNNINLDETERVREIMV